MGIKKLVIITVEAEIEIELPDLLANPTKEHIEEINYCDFDVEVPNDVYREAARLILLGFDDCNNDIFGVFSPSWRKAVVKNPERECFFNLRDLYIEDYEVENL